MIFDEGTDMNLNYLQPKGICIFPKIMGYRTKVSFFIKQPNITFVTYTCSSVWKFLCLHLPVSLELGKL